MRIIVAIVFALVLLSKPVLAEGKRVKIIITSYERTARQQAYIIKKDYNAGVNLKGLYKDGKLIKALLKVVNKDYSISKMEAIIIRYKHKGEVLSLHLCGQALDISKYGKNVKSFISFMRSIDDIKVLDEGDHYHIQTQKKCVK